MLVIIQASNKLLCDCLSKWHRVHRTVRTQEACLSSTSLSHVNAKGVYLAVGAFNKSFRYCSQVVSVCILHLSYIHMYLSASYPFEPPKVKFRTKVWHPNISSQTGVRAHVTTVWTGCVKQRSLTGARSAMLISE